MTPQTNEPEFAGRKANFFRGMTDDQMREYEGVGDATIHKIREWHNANPQHPGLLNPTAATIASGAPAPIGPNPPKGGNRPAPNPIGPHRDPYAADIAHRNMAAMNQPGAVNSARAAANSEREEESEEDVDAGGEVFVVTAAGQHLPATVTKSHGGNPTRVDLEFNFNGQKQTLTQSPHDPTGCFPDSWHNEGEPQEWAEQQAENDEANKKTAGDRVRPTTGREGRRENDR